VRFDLYGLEFGTGLVGHIIDRRFDFVVAQAGIAAFCRHGVEAFECMFVQGFFALFDTRSPIVIFTDNRSARDGTAVAHFTAGFENGLAVDIRHLGTEQIELRLNDKSAVLQNATTASGERYVATKGLYGRGAEWHQKGSEGILNFIDPYGNAVETNCRSGIIRN